MLITAIILSAILPGIVVLGLLRVTFNQYVGPVLVLIVTILLLVRFSLPWYTLVIGILSVLVGFVLARKWSVVK